MTAQNMETAIKADQLTITVDLSKEFGKSKSEKNMIIASSRGAVALKDGAKLNLNIYRVLGEVKSRKFNSEMQNIAVKPITDSTIQITVDLRKDFGKSSSGKTNIIASSRGNRQLFPENYPSYYMGLNIYRK